MTIGHIFFIPLIFLAGLTAGVMLGRRSVMAEADEETQRAERRDARRAARAAAPKSDPDA